MRAILVAGLAFGDEGKGACVDALTRQYPVDLIVRYNGGCQAQHAVVLPDGTSHCFSQFGAGMLANDTVRTHLSRYMLVEPLSMMNEAMALEKLTPNVWQRTTVDADAVITTPLHSQLNRLRERSRGKDCHGSCGRGIGVTRELHLKYGDEVLFAGDFQKKGKLFDKLYNIWDYVGEETKELARSFKMDIDNLWTPQVLLQHYNAVPWPATIVSDMEPRKCMVFEGAQGVMLDEKHGTAPHNTWTNTTFENADALLDDFGVEDRVRIGCIRSYYTRHGQGPFPTEDKSLNLPEPHNNGDGFQGNFRQGHFDWDLLKKALAIVGGVDYFAVSHTDCLDDLGFTVSDFLDKLDSIHCVGMTANGPTHAHRQFGLVIA